MRTVHSKDGTTIAFDATGKGPVVILVGGALEQRSLNSETAQLAPLLAQRFTVYHYDRRGRGDSTDTKPYAVEREVEDIQALVNDAGGAAFLFGISSGAALAMEAAIKLGDRVKRLAMYEAPYNSDDTARQEWMDYRKRLEALVAEGRGADALVLFMMLVGMPEEQVAEARRHPLWPEWESAALTLAYDAAVMGEDASIPLDKATRVSAPALVMAGGESPPFMHIAAEALARAMPDGRFRMLEGQTHEVSAEALAPVLVEFFTGVQIEKPN